MINPEVEPTAAKKSVEVQPVRVFRVSRVSGILGFRVRALMVLERGYLGFGLFRLEEGGFVFRLSRGLGFRLTSVGGGSGGFSVSGVHARLFS